MLGSVGRVGRVGRTRDAASVVVPVGKTYADFVTWANAQGATTRAWGAVAGTGGGANDYLKTTAAAATGVMTGSPETSAYWLDDAVTARLVQHALPSQAVFNDQVANGRIIIVRSALFGVEIGAGEYLFGANRNGYASQGRDGPVTNLGRCEFIAWWDDTAKKAYYRNPRDGIAPAELVI